MPKARELTRAGRRLATQQKRDDAHFLEKTFKPASNGAQIQESQIMKLEKSDRINSNRLNAIEKTLLKLVDKSLDEIKKNNAIEQLAYSLSDKNGRYLGETADGEKVFENVSAPAFIEPLQAKIQLASSQLESGDLAMTLSTSIEKRSEIADVRRYLETENAKAAKIGKLKADISQKRIDIDNATNDTEREHLHAIIEKLEMELANI